MYAHVSRSYMYIGVYTPMCIIAPAAEATHYTQTRTCTFLHTRRIRVRYIYIYREREREKERKLHAADRANAYTRGYRCAQLCAHDSSLLHAMFAERERERERGRIRFSGFFVVPPARYLLFLVYSLALLA